MKRKGGSKLSSLLLHSLFKNKGTNLSILSGRRNPNHVPLWNCRQNKNLPIV